jgi:osmotically inducible protein OsmC
MFGRVGTDRLGFGVIRKAKAVWVGTGRAGHGVLSTHSGLLTKVPYSFRTRFESGMGTNPEELIAAAHAGCFTMALALRMQSVGYTPTELNTEAAVSLDQEGSGFRITRSALTLRATVPNMTQTTFERLAKDAELDCPVSTALTAEIILDAKLL